MKDLTKVIRKISKPHFSDSKIFSSPTNSRAAPKNKPSLNNESIKVSKKHKPVNCCRVPKPCACIALALIETLVGYRCLHQLEKVIQPYVLDILWAHIRRGTYRGSKLASLHSQMPTPKAVEFSGRIATKNGRNHACTFRLDQHNKKWECTHFQLLTPGKY